MKSIAVFHGILCGLLLTLIAALVFETRLSSPLYYQLLIFIVLIGGAFYRMLQSDRENFSFPIAIKTGLQISLIAGVISSIFLIMYFTILHPNYVNEQLPNWKSLLEAHNQKLINASQAPININEKLENLKSSYSPFKQATYNIALVLFFGGFTSVVLGFGFDKLRKRG